ncbi:MAG: LysR substrate-binding domain-containing protein, partial [Comamonas sp.]
QGQPLPYLGYAAGAYLGRVTELILKEASEAVHLERVYETDMAEGLKAMALEGHGVAFLPYSAVRGELESGRLVSAVPAGMKGFQMDMEVRAYREKPAGDTPQGGAAALWTFLKEQGETANGEARAV